MSNAEIRKSGILETSYNSSLGQLSLGMSMSKILKIHIISKGASQISFLAVVGLV